MSNLRPPIAWVLRRAGVAKLHPGSLTLEEVGQKAYGLYQVPSIWVPPFCCISADCFEELTSALSSPKAGAKFERDLRRLLRSVGWAPNQSILVRSSGVVEGLAERGRYISRRSMFRGSPRSRHSCARGYCRLPNGTSASIGN